MASPSAALVLRHIRRWASGPNASNLPDQQLLQRFVAQREEAAFSALVERHGPMVLRVCQRVLHDRHAAEDAFQATFLVLVRKARAIRKRELLANWLYGVAHRIAMRAKVDSARRRNREERSEPKSPADPLAEVTGRELCAVLDEELNRLPQRFRAPFQLCYVEGLTRDQAAQQLSWSLRTLQRRLEQGRKLLHSRLTRRGVTLSAALLAAGLSKQAASAAVPPLLVISTVKAASVFAAGKGVAAAGISAPVEGLAEEILRGLAVAKMKVVVMLVLVVGIVTAGAGLLARQAVGLEPEQPTAQQRPPVAAKGAERQQPEQTRQAHVDRYGDPLPSEAIARLGTVRFRNAEVFRSVAYTPDGKTLVSGGWGGARIWDAATGKEIRRMGGELPNPHGPAALSPDGKLVAVAGWGQDTGGAAVYEVTTGRLVYRFGKPSQAVVPSFSPDGKILAVSEGNPIIDLYQAATGEHLRAIKVHEHKRVAFYQIAGMAFTRDGKVLVSAGGDGAIRFWDVATGKELRRIVDGKDGVGMIALSPDSSLLASLAMTKVAQGGGQTTVFGSNRVRLWDVASEKELRELIVPTTDMFEGRPIGPHFMAFTPDGKALLTGGGDGTLRVWDPLTGKELRRFTDHRGSLSAIAFAPGGKTFAVADAGQTVRVRDLVTGQDLVPTGGHRAEIWAVAISPDARAVATAGSDRMIYLWDARTGRELRRLAGHDGIVRALTYSGDGRVLFSTGDDSTLRVWDTATGRELRRHTGRQRYPGALALSPDGKTLATAAPDKTIVLLDVATGQELRALKGSVDRIVAVSFSPDGGTLHAWSYDRNLRRWDLGKGKCLAQSGSGLPDELCPAAFSPDGRFAAFGGQRRYIPVVEVATGREIHRFANRSGEGNDAVHCLAFSPDGRSLAWGGPRDSMVRLGELATSRARQHFAGHGGSVQSLAFSADGKVLVSGSQDTTALVWDLTGRLCAKRAWGRKLSSEELDACWADLAGEDAARAYQAICTLAARPEQTLPFLQEHLKAVAPVDAQCLARLLAELDSNVFAVRTKATAELEKLAELAEPALRQALKRRPTLEARQRIERLLGKLGEPRGQQLQALRAMEVLEQIGTPGALQLLANLAEGAKQARLTQDAKASLERLNRRFAANK